MVFKFPRTPVPLSLAHVDGTLHNMTWATLMHKLSLLVIEIYVLLKFVIRSMVDLPSTLGEVAGKVFEKLMELGKKQVDFVCDRYIAPSIKDIEHAKKKWSS